MKVGQAMGVRGRPRAKSLLHGLGGYFISLKEVVAACTLATSQGAGRVYGVTVFE